MFKKFFKISKNNACIFLQGMLIYLSGRETATKYPGVAKFGIALEWGSRGLEFESRHSDQQKALKSFDFSAFSLFSDFFRFSGKSDILNLS